MLRFSMFKSLDGVRLDWLKENHCRLYYFGLGFIQLKIDEFYRLHFYHPELPAFNEDIHNHRYDFKSTILKGTFHNSLYCVSPGETHIITNESCNPEIKAPTEVKFCSAELELTSSYEAGQDYFMDHTWFHTVKAENCITLLERTDYKKEFAQVITPVDGVSTCPFSKKLVEADLWALIAEMLG